MKKVDKKIAKQRKIIASVVILLGIMTIAIMAVTMLGIGNNKLNPNNEINYVEVQGGGKVNTSTEVSKDKTVAGVIISKGRIVYEGGMSKLTSKVTNNSEAKDNLRFKVKFMDNKGNLIAESVGFVGQIKESETKYIDSYITIDVSNSRDVVYEIME